MIKSGFFISWVMLAIGEVAIPFAPELGTLTQVGALGVLAWVAWTQRAEIQSLRREHKAVVDVLCIRWDAWEKIRHDDSNELNLTLRNLSTTWATTKAEIENRFSEKD